MEKFLRLLLFDDTGINKRFLIKMNKAHFAFCSGDWFKQFGKEQILFLLELNPIILFRSGSVHQISLSMLSGHVKNIRNIY